MRLYQRTVANACLMRAFSTGFARRPDHLRKNTKSSDRRRADILESVQIRPTISSVQPQSVKSGLTQVFNTVQCFSRHPDACDVASKMTGYPASAFSPGEIMSDAVVVVPLHPDLLDPEKDYVLPPFLRRKLCASSKGGPITAAGWFPSQPSSSFPSVVVVVEPDLTLANIQRFRMELLLTDAYCNLLSTVQETQRLRAEQRRLFVQANCENALHSGNKNGVITTTSQHPFAVLHLPLLSSSYSYYGNESNVDPSDDRLRPLIASRISDHFPAASCRALANAFSSMPALAALSSSPSTYLHVSPRCMETVTRAFSQLHSSALTSLEDDDTRYNAMPVPERLLKETAWARGREQRVREHVLQAQRFCDSLTGPDHLLLCSMKEKHSSVDIKTSSTEKSVPNSSQQYSNVYL